MRQNILKSRIEENAFEYANNMAVKMKIREMRKVLTDQFCGMGDFLNETADKIAGSKNFKKIEKQSESFAIEDWKFEQLSDIKLINRYEEEHPKENTAEEDLNITAEIQSADLTSTILHE